MKEPDVLVDTVRLRGRVRDADAVRLMSSATYHQKTDMRTGELRADPVAGVDTLPSGARIGIDKLNAGGWEAWVEFSAPKIGTGSNVIALPLRQAVEVSRQFMRKPDSSSIGVISSNVCGSRASTWSETSRASNIRNRC